MSFRRRVVLLAAGAVAAAVVLASVVVYFVTRGELLGQIDYSLRQIPQSVQVRGSAPELVRLLNEGKLPPARLQGKSGLPQLAKLIREGKLSGNATVQVGEAVGGGTAIASSGSVVARVHPDSGAQGVTVERQVLTGAQATAVRKAGSSGKAERAVPAGGGVSPSLALPSGKLGPATGYVQLFSGGSLVHSPSPGLLLPVTDAARAVAAGRRPAFYSDVEVHGEPARMFVERAGSDAVWQAALPLGDFENTLSHLRLVLALVCLGGVALAAALGLLVSRAALAPVRRLTGAAEQVARTQDLGHRIEVGEEGELGRLASTFNTMLAALERSRLAQRQLVSDASHELRTPMTSLRANLDALAIGEGLSPRERARVVAAVQEQLRELTVLMGDLTDLSQTEVDELEIEDVRLDLAAEAAIRRAALHAPLCQIELDAEPCLARASPARLDRAIANLLDNACQWTDPCAGPVRVTVREGVLEVRDRGPGFAEEDLPRVFDRFYRSAGARSRPGSGLGLAIVRQAAELLGGAVHAANDPAGGACLTLQLPPLEMSADERACQEVAALHDSHRLL